MTLKILLFVLVVLIILIAIPIILSVFGISIFGGSQNVSTGRAEDVPGDILISSPDSGLTWVNAAFSDTKGLAFPTSITSIAFHPRESNILFLSGKDGGLWKSNSEGISWQKVSDPLGALQDGSTIYNFSISRSDPRVMYLAAYQNKRGRVLKTQDDARSFQEIYQVTANRYGVFDVFVTPSNSEHAYAVTGQGGLFETTDGGATWGTVRWFGTSLERLTVDPGDSSHMIVLDSSARIWETRNGGVTWREIKIPTMPIAGSGETPGQPLDSYAPPSFFFNPFAIFGSASERVATDPHTLNRILVSNANGLFQTSDGGSAWKKLSTPIPDGTAITAIAISPGNSSMFFVAAKNTLYRTIDGGATWSSKIFNTRKSITHIFIHPLSPNNIYLSFE